MAEDKRVSSGILGLDEVLRGGFIPARSYLLSGPPGTGKTTFGWHFLINGIDRGERTLLISFGEAESDLRANAERSGFDVRASAILDMSPSSEFFSRSQGYDIFAASEVEREPIMQRIRETFEEVAPSRVFVDSISSLRYLAGDAHEFRRQVLSMLRFFVADGAVVLMSSEATKDQPDDDLRFLADGVIELAIGPRVRTLRVTKFRGSGFGEGVHTVRLDGRGAEVFARLVPADAAVASETFEVLSSGLPELDALLHGGLERGTVTLITGPTGVGKTTLGMQFISEAASLGHRSVAYAFDERGQTLLRRSASVGIGVKDMLERDKLRVVDVEPLRFGPDEFAAMVREDVQRNGTRIVMIDSVSGYRMAVADDGLAERLHALCRYLELVGVTVILVNELQNVLEFRITEVGISYLADNVVYLRYLERFNGRGSQIIKGIGVLKKRLSGFENSVREFSIAPSGLRIGEPLAGVLNPVALTNDGYRSS